MIDRTRVIGLATCVVLVGCIVKQRPTGTTERVVATRGDENLTHAEVAALLEDLLPTVPSGCDGQQGLAELLVAVAPRADGNNATNRPQ